MSEVHKRLGNWDYRLAITKRKILRRPKMIKDIKEEISKYDTITNREVSSW